MERTGRAIIYVNVESDVKLFMKDLIERLIPKDVLSCRLVKGAYVYSQNVSPADKKHFYNPSVIICEEKDRSLGMRLDIEGRESYIIREVKGIYLVIQEGPLNDEAEVINDSLYKESIFETLEDAYKYLKEQLILDFVI